MDFLYSLLVTIRLLFYIFPNPSNAADSIRPPQFLTDNHTLVSKDGSFELGFFSPGNPNHLYLGIWYKTIPIRTVVWVANRDNPIQDSHGSLQINNRLGTLEILSGNNQSLVWSSNSSKQTLKNPIVQLLDSGNLVLIDEKEGEPDSVFLWESFDYPCDTLLPDMKLGGDLKTGFRRHLMSWRASDDPSRGDFSYGIELHSYPEAVMWRGSEKHYRTGPWNGVRYSGAPELRPNRLYHFEFNVSKDGIYYSYQLKDKSVISRLVINGTSSSGQRYIWVEAEQSWELYLSFPRDLCDRYSLCGLYGICDISESPVCQCLKGFEPKSPVKWGVMDWSQGCVRIEALNCSNQNGFARFDGLKLPDTTHTWVDTSMVLEECRAKCLADCNCTAYANSDVRGGGRGCAIWYGNLTDMRQLPIGGQELYVRMPNSELKVGASHSPKKIIAVIIVATIAVICGVLIILYYIQRHRTTLRENKIVENEAQVEDLELPLFDLATIGNATNNFADKNKLGEGGFGPVYKGTLPDGQEIAVKRLSMSSGQGSNEFKNEVTLIAKLQHRNLVKLLGYCIEREDRMLIYEYMPNKSLDLFIFDPARSKVLDWSRRFQIICGIARGLLYLHQDSRLRIIHRDLKASNVLLDNEMNPKISDFGLARSFGNDLETTANTNRVVGTYGYMAPEYAVDGVFSIKSDVYSFGVLLLEIVTGKKNRGFYHQSHGLNLTGHAWRLWKEGRSLELVHDPSYGGANSVSEILRCVHIGLLCVQQQPEERPNMSSVILMLSSSESPLAEPKQPGFFVDRNPIEVGESSSSKNISSSTNEISISLLEAR